MPTDFKQKSREMFLIFLSGTPSVSLSTHLLAVVAVVAPVPSFVSSLSLFERPAHFSIDLVKQ